jgi:hypothetical protein
MIGAGGRSRDVDAERSQFEVSTWAEQDRSHVSWSAPNEPKLGSMRGLNRTKPFDRGERLGGDARTRCVGYRLATGLHLRHALVTSGQARGVFGACLSPFPLSCRVASAEGDRHGSSTSRASPRLPTELNSPGGRFARCCRRTTPTFARPARGNCGGEPPRRIIEHYKCKVVDSLDPTQVVSMSLGPAVDVSVPTGWIRGEPTPGRQSRDGDRSRRQGRPGSAATASPVRRECGRSGFRTIG